MNHPEAHYIDAGYRYERLSVPASRIKRAQQLQDLIKAETPEDQTLARELIQRGRKEFQLHAKG
jgi:hypothetical protein